MYALNLCKKLSLKHMAWLTLIRWKNLVIVLLTQLLAWYCLIYGTARYFAKPGFLDFKNFFHLLLSTLMITAAGYIINDYFDIKIDNINKPAKMVLVNKIPLRVAIITHAALNILALGFCFVVAAHGGHFSWMLLQLACITLLWFYSTHFKRRFAIGNIVVALLTALTIAVLVLYEPMMYSYLGQPAIIHFYRDDSYLNPVWVAAAYCLFAFMLTWMREIVKDMEDIKGDEAEGCKTMPVIIGLERSVKITRVLGIFTILMLLGLIYPLYIVRYHFLSIYTGLLLVVPLIAWLFFLPRHKTPEHFHSASRWLKIIMLAGICSLIVYNFHVFDITCTE